MQELRKLTLLIIDATNHHHKDKGGWEEGERKSREDEGKKRVKNLKAARWHLLYLYRGVQCLLCVSAAPA